MKTPIRNRLFSATGSEAAYLFENKLDALCLGQVTEQLEESGYEVVPYGGASLKVFANGKLVARIKQIAYD